MARQITRMKIIPETLRAH